MSEEVKLVPIDQIRILNPRHRDQKKFELIVQSIRNLGLKMPIQVSRRQSHESEGDGYDLVCGQGRIEAFIALGYQTIPAVVVDIPKEERLIRSLVENIARRYPSPMELMDEIERLQALGYNNSQISKKLDVGATTIGSLVTLKNAGEERILKATLAGKIPIRVAADIAKTDTIEMQRELLKAYENNQLDFASIRAVKRLIEQRRLIGKGLRGTHYRKNKPSAESLVNVYRRECLKQKLMVKKARLCEGRLTFIVTALKKLLADEHFTTLLRAESMPTMPKYLWDRLNPKGEGVA